MHSSESVDVYMHLLFVVFDICIVGVMYTLYGVSQEERTKLWEGVPYVELYGYNPKHLCPKLNGFQDNGK